MRACAPDIDNFGRGFPYACLEGEWEYEFEVEVEIDFRERGVGETPFLESARAGAEGYPPNIRNPRGKQR